MTHKKSLGQTDMILFTVSAILLLDTLTAAASIGVSSLFWWALLGLIFFVPFAWICAEMGCTYPEQGGIYAWVRDAFGGRWAARASWGYWVNTAVWLPAIFILFAGVFKQMFVPDLSIAMQIGMGVVLTWVAVFVNIAALDVGKWVPNMGAVLKVLIFLAIIVGAGFHVAEHGMANPINWNSIAPDWDSSLQFIPAIIYGMLGFELVSASSEEMRNPGRDVPRAILVSGTIIIVFYSLGTAAVLAAIPAGDIDLVEGLMDTLMLFYGGSQMGQWFALFLGVAALYTFFSNGVTWAMGCNRAAAEAARENELPALFARENPRRGTPVGAALAMGVFSSLVLCLYGFLAGSNEDLFWSLFAFSAVIFLLPYLGMLLAFLKMRQVDASRHRPFRVPGGQIGALVCAVLCLLVLSVSIVLFVYTPGEGVQVPVLVGVILTLGLGELAIRYAEHQRGNITAISANE